MCKDYFKETIYINWKEEATVYACNSLEYNDVLKDIRAKYQRVYIAEKTNKLLRDNFPIGTYDEYVPKSFRGTEYRIYCNDPEMGYVIYKCRRDGRELTDQRGTQAFDEVSDFFKKRTGVSLREAFGSSPYEYNQYTPRPLYFVNPFFLSPDENNIKEITCINSIDGCSQYPTALSGDLPTMKESIIKIGRHQPTEEYPFAIYLKSGHLAVYNEYDTHNWVDSIYRGIIFDPYHLTKMLSFNDEDEQTLLLKKSQYSLKEEMRHFYDIKQSYPKDSNEYIKAKLIMNAFIGFLHRKNPKGYKNTPFNHLALFALARANQKMIDKLEMIEPYNVIHVCVDGIIYRGGQILGGKIKDLGKFEQEFDYTEEYTMAMRGQNAYIIKKDDEVKKWKHGGYQIDANGELFNDDTEAPTDYAEMFNWYSLDNSSDYDKNGEYYRKHI